MHLVLNVLYIDPKMKSRRRHVLSSLSFLLFLTSSHAEGQAANPTDTSIPCVSCSYKLHAPNNVFVTSDSASNIYATATVIPHITQLANGQRVTRYETRRPSIGGQILVTGSTYSYHSQILTVNKQYYEYYGRELELTWHNIPDLTSMRQPVCNRIDSYTVYDRITTIVENALAFYVLAAALTVDAQRSGYTLNQDLITCSHAGIAPLVVNTAKFLTHVTGDAVETTLASIDFPTSIVASHSPTILLPAPTADSTKHESSLTRSSQTEKKSKSTSSKKESTLGPVGLPSQNAIIPSVTNQNSMSTVTETKTVTASPLMVLVTLTESVTFYANTTCAAVNNRTWTPIEITVTPIDISRVTSSVGPGTAENLNSDSTLNMGSVILCQGGFGDSSACSAGPTVTSIGGDTSSQTIIAATGNNGSTVVVPWWLYVAVLMIGAWIHGLS